MGVVDNVAATTENATGNENENWFIVSERVGRVVDVGEEDGWGGWWGRTPCGGDEAERGQ